MTGPAPGDFVYSFGDAHLDRNHFDQARLGLARSPGPLPTLRLAREVRDLFAFRVEDIGVEGYELHPAISAPVAV